MDERLAAFYGLRIRFHGELSLVVGVVLVDAEEDVVRAQNIDQSAKSLAPFSIQESTVAIVDTGRDEDLFIMDVAATLRLVLFAPLTQFRISLRRVGV